jgi:superfamily II DNA or RNA helicase
VPYVVGGVQPYGLPGADCYIFRYSNIRGWADIAATGMFRSVVWDEIQELRNGEATNKGEAAAVFADNAALRLGLTATPIYNYGSEIFHVMRFIEPGVLGEFAEFVREWCHRKGNHWIVNDPDALGTYLREQHLAVRELRSGRRVNKIVREVPYDEEAERSSLELARVLAIKTTTGTWNERGQAALELDALARHTTGVAKARGVAGVARIFLENGIPIILAGWHRDVYDIWLEELKEFGPVMFTGSENAKQKDAAKHAFAAGRTDLFLISLRSGTGLDGLQQRCSTVLVGEYDWSPKVIEQLIGRVDRPGQTAEEVTAVFCHANGGSDPLMVGVLGLKASQARGITDPLAGVEHVYSDESRIKALAELYLRRSGP